MCIGVSWSSSKVAHLAFVFNVLSAVVGFYSARQSVGLAPWLTVLSFAVGTATCLFLARGRSWRLTGASVLVVALTLHGAWYLSFRDQRRQMDARIAAVCARPEALPNLSHASPELSSLLELVPDGALALDADGVGAMVAEHMDVLEAELERMRAAFPKRKQAPPSKERLCAQSLAGVVFGSLLELLTVHVVIGNLTTLLNGLCAVRVWCELTDRGRAFRRWLELEEDPLQRRDE